MEYWNRKMPDRKAVHMPASQNKPASKAPALSGSIQSLLSMAMVNELSEPQMLGMLRDLYPFATSSDRNAISDILGYEQAAKELAYHASRPNLGGFSMKKRYLTHQDRILGMLEVFKKYNPESAASFAQMEQILRMQKSCLGWILKTGEHAFTDASVWRAGYERNGTDDENDEGYERERRHGGYDEKYERHVRREKRREKKRPGAPPS